MTATPGTPAPSADIAGWSIWATTKNGVTTWWGTRDRLLTESEIRDGLVHTLRADSEVGLREQLDLARGAELRAEYPDWVIQHMPEANLPWEARRLPFRLPPLGGYGWLHADTAHRLRELIGGALQAEAQHAAEDASRRAAS
ncbi:hypothetical protein [Actinomadura sp. 7K507]|uniref:hypothetical protein n=1 Tax=Actinomadura sp. 7K507 TaxID=2530365 RepID=UPI0010488B68|nr:hypothetical protein [Actinomadura sp. 7K507]TDC96566.1 hypothetical protein E1285_05365 [Actinomadura sp. 7K507]